MEWIIGGAAIAGLCWMLARSQSKHQRKIAADMSDEQLREEIALSYGYGEAKPFMDELAKREGGAK